MEKKKNLFKDTSTKLRVYVRHAQISSYVPFL